MESQLPIPTQNIVFKMKYFSMVLLYLMLQTSSLIDFSASIAEFFLSPNHL